MLIALTGAAAGTALLAIAADWNERRRRSFYLLKPLTTALIAALAAAGTGDAPQYQQWIVAALLLSLIGDVCLMFSGDRWFLAGLSAFLLAHLAFAGAFLQGVGVVDLPGWLVLLPLSGAVLLWFVLPRAGALKLPVLLYGGVIACMVFAAAARHEALGMDESLAALAGALVFVVSDSALAVRRFVRRYRHAQALILSTYWTAIGLIAWSV